MPIDNRVSLVVRQRLQFFECLAKDAAEIVRDYEKEDQDTYGVFFARLASACRCHAIESLVGVLYPDRDCIDLLEAALAPFQEAVTSQEWEFLANARPFRNGKFQQDAKDKIAARREVRRENRRRSAAFKREKDSELVAAAGASAASA